MSDTPFTPEKRPQGAERGDGSNFMFMTLSPNVQGMYSPVQESPLALSPNTGPFSNNVPNIWDSPPPSKSTALPVRGHNSHFLALHHQQLLSEQQHGTDHTVSHEVSQRSAMPGFPQPMTFLDEDERSNDGTSNLFSFSPNKFPRYDVLYVQLPPCHWHCAELSVGPSHPFALCTECIVQVVKFYFKFAAEPQQIGLQTLHGHHLAWRVGGKFW